MTLHAVASEPKSSDVARFRAVVAACLGLRFDEDRLDFLADVLKEQIAARGTDVATYLERLHERSPAEFSDLARRLTIGESYFFRYFDQFRAFIDVALPECAAAHEDRRRLRVLSAGCASGEEAYSLAILIRENLPEAASWDIDVVGIDVNPAMIERARRGLYSSWSLRETPDAMRARYFLPHGRHFQLDERVRSWDEFEERNLVDDDPAFYRPGAFDAVFCRNVTMYFTPEVARAVVGRIARALSPGGYLFLGHAETLRGISSDFKICHTHKTFYYRLREPHERGGADSVFPPPRAPSILPPDPDDDPGPI